MLTVKKKRIVIPYRSVVKWLVKLRRSPQAIAGGFALGTFVAFTPTMGIQFFIAMILATLLNMNRPAAFVMIWITNIATVAPIYTFNYWVGSIFWEGPSVNEVYRTFMDLTAKLARIGSLGYHRSVQSGDESGAGYHYSTNNRQYYRWDYCRYSGLSCVLSPDQVSHHQTQSEKGSELI